MFKYFILFLSLLTLASCTKTEATPSNTMKQTENASIPSKQTLLYVDVREDEEWAAGHIEWAKHVKLGDIEAGNFSAIPKDTPLPSTVGVVAVRLLLMESSKMQDIPISLMYEGWRVYVEFPSYDNTIYFWNNPYNIAT
jgi:rhodanese-related sulfurtransferase